MVKMCEKKTRETDVTLQVYWSPLYQRTETGLRGTDETAQVTPGELAGTPRGVIFKNKLYSQKYFQQDFQNKTLHSSRQMQKKYNHPINKSCMWLIITISC